MSSVGLKLRLEWGDRRVGDYFLREAKPGGFWVGSGPKVHFAMGSAKLGASRFQLVQWGAEGARLRFTPAMSGIRRRGPEETSLESLAASGEAFEEEGANALALSPGDEVRLDLGNIRLHACFEKAPRRAAVSFGETLDLCALTCVMVVAFVALLFIVNAVNQVSQVELAPPKLTSEMVALMVKPKSPSPLALKVPKKVETNAGTLRASDVGHPAHRRPPVKGKGSPNLSRMFAGLDKVLGGSLGPGLGGSIVAALNGLNGSRLSQAGMPTGLQPRGDASGGETFGIIGGGPIGTRNLRGTQLGYRTGNESARTKVSLTPEIHADPPVVQGAMDPELVRQVIRQHVDQVRYCYESQLPQHPDLHGKVAVKFIIDAGGAVATSSIAQTTVGNPELEECIRGRVKTWLFPRPKGGGTAIVTYPFVLERAGSQS